MNEEISQIVEDIMDETVKKVEDKEEESSSAPKITLKAKTSGIAALLASLRNGEPSTSTSADSDEPLMKRTKALDGKPEKPLNRKERRALQQAELKEKHEANKQVEEKKEDSTPAPFLFEKATPPSMTMKFMDENSYHDYKASFGYTCTRKNNYVRFALQSSSGDFTAVASQDRYVRVYNMKENQDGHPIISWKHNMGGLIYDLVWLKKQDEECFATTSKDHPIHLWNAKTGERMAAYIGKDHADAVEAAFCVGQVGDMILGGYKKDFKIWDIERVTKPISSMTYYDATYGSGLTGRAMSIDENPTMSKVFAAVGCSDRIVVYSQQWNSAVTTIAGPGKSYTHVRYSLDGNRIFASERKGDIHVFDVRMNMCCQIMKREMKVNHRSVFDIDFKNRILYSGTSSGEIVAFDICDFNEEIQPISKIRVASTCVPCVSICSDSSSTLVCCSGERFFPQSDICDSDEDNENKLDSVTLYPSNSFQVLDVLF